MVYTLRFFFSSKSSLFHNSNIFGSCIIHIVYTGCAKIKKNNSGAKRLMMSWGVHPHSPQTYIISKLYFKIGCSEQFENLMNDFKLLWLFCPLDYVVMFRYFFWVGSLPYHLLFPLICGSLFLFGPFIVAVVYSWCVFCRFRFIRIVMYFVCAHTKSIKNLFTNFAFRINVL